MPEEEGSDVPLSAVPLTTVSVKLPTFWTDSPEVWFIQAEAQFENKRITTSRTKFTHLLPRSILKVSLRARLAGTDWFHHLPLVLLGIRSVPREDSSVSASEALYGSPLVLPQKFLNSPELPSLEYLRRIQSILKNSASVLPHHSTVPATKPDEIPSSLVSCSHVFIREDASKPSLSPLYRGSYLVLSKYPKYKYNWFQV